MLKVIAALLLVATAACNRPPASASRAPAASASPTAASSTTPAPSGITANTGGGMQVVDPGSYRRGAISTTRTP